MPAVRDYEKQVYAAVLGKTIGVYMGRPFEGWTKARLEERWGRVDRYVNEDQGVPLVVADDDISGTLTFIRALEDSGLYADTPPEFFGDTWLNYLIEGKTVLWWGGLGMSTEHTAYLRLKHGIKAPQSGSIETNGRTVAEQIGAQIFIDAFGMVAPGRPELAARLARRSAAVSHDGEAVHAAAIVAGMVSAAFTEKRMERLLDIGVSLVPQDSLIAQVHRDVRAWRRKDDDWRRTYDRIDKRYGYAKYGGNCHVVPNHAIMVMAWAYAPDDFHEALTIINTAGWDTDCNSANVGSVMGMVVGLDRINEKYDFQGPMADRILLPTAEGTHAATDALTQALRIARIGRRIMGWPAAAPPKRGAWHHFEMPRAVHGWRPEVDRFDNRGAAAVENVAGHSKSGTRSLRVALDVGPGRIARISTPVLPAQGSGGHSYAIVGVPRVYPGMKLAVRATVGRLDGGATARLFVAPLAKPDGTSVGGGPGAVGGGVLAGVQYGRAVTLRKGAAVVLSLQIEDTDGWPVERVGIEICGAGAGAAGAKSGGRGGRGDLPGRAVGELFIDTVDFSGGPDVAWPAILPRIGDEAPGWIKCGDHLGGPFSDDREPLTRVGRNEGRGVLVTGTTDWRDYAFEARVGIHCADAGGIIVRYQGLERYIALVHRGGRLELVRRHYGDTLLAEAPARWRLDELHALRLVCRGKKIVAWADGRKLFEATDGLLGCGGAGLMFENGLIGFRDVRVGGG